ncbi:MAG: ATP-binding protein [Candidatus Methanoperedens sp.]|nr:ATP-binding protein [Candidatus Methanoperedens sp.]
MAAGVAHEINNPLGNISLYTQMLLKNTDDENTKEKLTIINDETNRAAQIVKGLLDFARQSEPKLTRIDINKEIEKVLGIMTPQLKDIKVTTELEPLPRIRADSGQIQQVIMNLLKNSIQSIKKKGELMIKTATKNDYVEINISDNGCGIPKEDLNKIFDPFFTTKEMGKGTGLGLSISYGIIKRHNGSIEVKSNIGKGTTLTIKLPV